MSNTLFTAPGERQFLASTIALPYTLTPGRAAGTFLSQTPHGRLVASRCTGCASVAVPAQDFCPCGTDNPELLAIRPTGTVTATTTTADGTFALIRIDGASSDLLHRLVDGSGVGSRVEAVWADEPSGTILDITGFSASDTAADTAPELAELDPEIEPTTVIPYQLSLDYEHSYGPYYGQLFDAVGSRQQILGSPCPTCHNVLVPPRERCDQCFTKTDRLVAVQETGRLQAFSVIMLEFVGQTRKPPYVYAEIVLDGSSTRLIHNLDGFDVSRAKELLSIGMPVRAVWRKPTDCIGTLDDIDYFQPLGDQFDPAGAGGTVDHAGTE
jgi:uncharacterized OB-fold protein